MYNYDDDDDYDDNDYDYDENKNKVWEPAHQLELVTKDAKGDPLFQWLADHIQTLNDITSILGIGKGLEQSLEAAEGRRESVQAAATVWNQVC